MAAERRSKPKPKLLDLSELASRYHPGLTRHGGGILAEAAAVCFEECEHVPGVELKTEGTSRHRYAVSFPRVDQQMREANNDPDEATERGACGIAIMLVGEQRGLSVLQRSRKGTGFDYWMGRNSGDGSLPFQGASRLEISGLRRATTTQIHRRVSQKLAQTKQSDNLRIPAIVVVVEFGRPVAHVKDKP